MKIEFLEPAQHELDEAIEYYNAQVVGLGNQFLDEVVNTLQRIADYPEAWQVFSEKTRRSLLHKFPFGVVYEIRNDSILIIAIANLHRKPNYWEERVKSN